MQNYKVLVLMYSVLSKPFWCIVSGQYPTNKWKKSKSMSGLENLKSTLTIKTKNTKPPKNLGGETMRNVGKPLCRNAINLSIWCKSRQRRNVWKLWKAVQYYEI